MIVICNVDYCCSLIFNAEFGLVLFLKKTVVKDEVFLFCALCASADGRGRHYDFQSYGIRLSIHPFVCPLTPISHDAISLHFVDGFSETYRE